MGKGRNISTESYNGDDRRLKAQWSWPAFLGAAASAVVVIGFLTAMARPMVRDMAEAEAKSYVDEHNSAVGSHLDELYPRSEMEILMKYLDSKFTTLEAAIKENHGRP